MRTEPEFDCEYKDELMCPYCGTEQTDSYESIPSDGGECGTTSCEECGKNFDFSVSREISYSTTCVEGTHSYRHNPTDKHPDLYDCERCGDTQFKNHIDDRVQLWRKRFSEVDESHDNYSYIKEAKEKAESKLNELRKKNE